MTREEFAGILQHIRSDSSGKGAKKVALEEYDRLVAELAHAEATIYNKDIALVTYRIEQEPVAWRYDDTIGTYACSNCVLEWTFEDEGPEENNCKYCPGCGRPIVIEKPLETEE